MRDMSPKHGEHVNLVTWESYVAWLRCETDKVQSYQTVLIVTLIIEVQAAVM